MICRSFNSLSLQIRDGKITKKTWNPSPPIPLSQLEVTVDMGYERHSTAQPITSVDGQLPVGDQLDRSLESLDNDLERAMGDPVTR